MSQVVQWLAELIELPSVNPAFAGSDGAVAGEHRVAAYVADRARAAGLEVGLQPVTEGRANVLVRLRPKSRPRYRVVLAPHMDTVSVSDPAQLRAQRRGDRIYGRGACDTKASLAAMLWVLVRAARCGAVPSHTEVVLAALVDEEFGQAGSRTLARKRWRVDLAVVGEPTRLQLVTAHKGSIWLRLHAQGRSAHAATPWLGRNAVAEVARAVELVHGDYARALQQRKHPLLGSPTVSVGRIGGGRQPNVVPEFAWAELDRRTLPGETPRRVVRELRTWLRRSGLRVAVELLAKGDCPALETDLENPWVRQWLRLLGQARPVGVHYFCDAAVLASAGIPAVVFGPGDIARAHTDAEWVSAGEVEAACVRLAAWMEQLP